MGGQPNAGYRLESQSEVEQLQRRLASLQSRKASLQARRSSLLRTIRSLREVQIKNEAKRDRAAIQLAEAQEALRNASQTEIQALTENESAALIVLNSSLEVVANGERRLSRAADRLGETDAELEQMNAEERARGTELDKRMEPSERIAWLSREVGQERGTDLALRVIFVRWWTLTDPSHQVLWSRLAGGENVPRELSELFSIVFPPEFALIDLETYEEFLEQLVPIVSSIGSSDSGNTQSSLASTFEAVLALSFERSRESGVWETPETVAHLLSQLVFHKGSTVLDPACGLARVLSTTAGSDPDASLQGIEINPDIAARAWMRLRIAQHRVDIAVGDAFGLIRETDKYDTVVLQPPWGVRLTSTQEAKTRDLISFNDAPETFLQRDLPWLLMSYTALSPGGRAAIILPASSLRDIHRQAHRYLLNIGAVEAIITLPEGGLFPHTRIGTAIWLLRRKHHPGDENARSVLIVDAESVVIQPGSRTPTLTADGASEIHSIVQDWRRSGDLNVPSHIAVTVPTDSPELLRGLDPRHYLAEPPVNQLHIPEPPCRLLRSIEIDNLKSFGGKTRIPLAPITIIFGANSAGKSTIIQSLLLLKQSVGSRSLVTQGLNIDVGGFAGIVHHQQSNETVAGANERSLGLTIEYGTLNSWIPPEGVPNPSYLRTVEYRFSASPPAPGELQTTTLQFGPHSLSLRTDREADRLILDLPAAASIFDGLASKNLVFPANDREFGSGATPSHQGRSRAATALTNLGVSGALADIPFGWEGIHAGGVIPPSRRTLSNLSGFEADIVRSYLDGLTTLVTGIAHEVRQLLKQVIYLGPLRSPPQRFYNRTAVSAHPGDAQHIAMYLFDHSNVVKNVNNWLEALEVPYAVDVLPVVAKGAGTLVGDLVALSLTDIRSGVVVTPADVGFGISQMLPIVVELLAHRESIICIEQPETHLHPRLQTRLADLLIESSRNGDLANQLIVETHSEHLLLRLQRRIREGAIDPSDISVLYVDQDTDGNTTATHLRIDDEGEFLDEWPDGFFDERLDELFGTN
jgi:hypothetical protein